MAVHEAIVLGGTVTLVQQTMKTRWVERKRDALTKVKRCSCFAIYQHDGKKV